MLHKFLGIEFLNATSSYFTEFVVPDIQEKEQVHKV